MDELQVECVHREQGCDHTCQRQLLSVHLRKECAYSEELCQEEGCMERVFRKDIGTHMEVKHKGKAPDACTCANAEGEDAEVVRVMELLWCDTQDVCSPLLLLQVKVARNPETDARLLRLMQTACLLI